MTPEKFKAWYASLPPASQVQAKRLHAVAAKHGAVTSSALAVIVELINDMTRYGEHTYDFEIK